MKKYNKTKKTILILIPILVFSFFLLGNFSASDKDKNIIALSHATISEDCKKNCKVTYNEECYWPEPFICCNGSLKKDAKTLSKN